MKGVMTAAGIRRRAIAVVSGVAMSVTVGCGASGSDGPELEPAFDAVFELERVIELEERPPDGMITRIQEVDVAPDGRLVIFDMSQDRVRIYAPDGSLATVVGRHGGGPGELHTPTAAAISRDGSLLVTEIGNRRFSRFGADLRYDTVLAWPDSLAGGRYMKRLDDEILVNAFARLDNPHMDVFHRMTPDGEFLGTIHPRNELLATVPYWEWHPERIAIGSERLYVSNNKVYPLHEYTRAGEPVDSFGVEPASWIQARKPEYGEFVPTGPASFERYEEFMRSFTWIDNLALQGDTLLVVAHGRYDPGNMGNRVGSYRADVYDVRDHRKIYEDITLPGRILASTEEGIYLLLAEPGEAEAWTIGIYTLREGDRGR